METAPALISLPIPRPGIAVSLAMIVRFFAPRLTSASIRRWGEPTPMKPPIRQPRSVGDQCGRLFGGNRGFHRLRPLVLSPPSLVSLR